MARISIASSADFVRLQVSMDMLPNEIILYLCDFVTDADDAKSLRLVQRRFANPAAKNVFRSLVLYPHPDKWCVRNLMFIFLFHRTRYIF